ncbi:hypothetical protein [Pseudoalteromonas sp. SaAl2]
MTDFKFSISFFLIALFLAGIYYYQEGSFKLSATLAFATIIIVIEVSIYIAVKLYKKYKQPPTT